MEDTIVAISTPVGEGGIGIVRLSGKAALSIADKIFVPKSSRKPSSCKAYSLHYGHIVNRTHVTRDERRETRDDIIDEVLLTVMRAPKSYTKEDVVEINCHGGIVPLRKVLELVLNLGARLAEPGEFTKRAFLNQRIDLAQAEAVLDIIKSKTDSSAKIAMGQLNGGLSTKIKKVKKELTDILGEIEARIDFSEEDIEFLPKEILLKKLESISDELKKLVDESRKGMIFKEGIMCVICGKPNVGKSSLMNALLGRNRVIVTPIPGTTRDAVEEEINLKGIPVRLVDTAGISARAKNIPDMHGVRKSKSYIEAADLILFMLDSSRSLSGEDKEIFNRIKDKDFITIANKSDLVRRLNRDKAKKLAPAGDVIEISLLKRESAGKIEEAILGKIWGGEIMQPEGAFVANARHRKELERANKYVRKAADAVKKKPSCAPEIASSELKEALSSLGSILGDTAGPDILDRIFSKFCVGK